MAKFFYSGTNIEKKRIPGLGLGKPEGVVRDAREVLRKTYCLVRVSVSRSDGCHESNSSCHTVTKVPSVCRITAVFVMGIDECVEEAQNHNAMLKPPQEHPRDQVVEQAIHWWYNRGVPPEGKKEVVQSGTHIIERDGVTFIQTSNTASTVRAETFSELILPARKSNSNHVNN